MSQTAEIKGGNLIITMPYDKVGKESKSGKSMIHASTGANSLNIDVDGKKLVISVNAYTAKK